MCFFCCVAFSYYKDGGSEGIRSATFILLLVLISFYFDAHFLSQCRYHAGVANNRFIGCLVGLLLLLYMASFASRLPTRSNPLSATSKQNEQANFCLFVLFGFLIRNSYNITTYPTIFVKNKVYKKADTFMYKISATNRLRLKLFSKKMVLKNFLGWC